MSDQPASQPDSAAAAPSTPVSRAQLLERHAAARARRNAAPLGSEAHRAAVHEIAEIEVMIASVDTGVPPSRP